MFEWLRLPQAGKWVTLNLADKADYSERLGAVLLDPPGQVLKRGGVEFEVPHRASFSMTVSRGRPSERCAATIRRFLIVSDFRRYAVSRSEAISRHRSMGTITAVGSPSSLETIWMFASCTISVYACRHRPHRASSRPIAGEDLAAGTPATRGPPARQ